MTVNTSTGLSINPKGNQGVKDLAKSKPSGAIGRAFAFAEKVHAKQKRADGEPYFNHVLATAETLQGWHLDEPTIVGGLLHDSVEDAGIALEKIKEEFGEEVSFLVDGVTKLGRIKFRGAKTKVENMRKMILALSQDLRVVFIKLADRSHNMKTLGALPPQKQKRIAMETDEIYAPLAYRLGMQNLSGELHDLSFPYLHPQEDRWLQETTIELYENRRKYLEKIQPIVEATLKEHHIKPIAIDFRAKRRSSLYRKLLRHDMDIERIYDLVAMRIVVKSIAECYAALGLIHEKWRPLPGRIKDYIAMPKPNSYRSLHTTVIGPEDKKIEIQIRTQEMHEENENGIAAHWVYQQKKKDKDVLSPQELTKEIRWVQQLRNWLASHPQWRGELASHRGRSGQEKLFGKDQKSGGFLQAMKVDFFQDRIFAISPRGDVMDLPFGATPVDFAYHIHSEVGHTCAGAKVNDQLVPLDHKLKSGDVVQILTQKNKKPSEDWLKFVKTSIARNHIKSVLREKGQFAKRAKMPTKAELRIVVEDRVGLIKDISTVIARSHMSIITFRAYDPAGSKFPVDKIEISSTDRGKIEKLILKLKKIRGVREVSYKLI